MCLPSLVCHDGNKIFMPGTWCASFQFSVKKPEWDNVDLCRLLTYIRSPSCLPDGDSTKETNPSPRLTRVPSAYLRFLRLRGKPRHRTTLYQVAEEIPDLPTLLVILSPSTGFFLSSPRIFLPSHSFLFLDLLIRGPHCAHRCIR